MTEFDHPIPEMETIADVLDYIKGRADGAGPRASGSSSARSSSPGSRSSAIRPREELDRVAPRTRSMFATGPDASVNSLALKLSGIDKDFKHRRRRARSKRTRKPASRPASSATARRYVKVSRRTASRPKRTATTPAVELFNDYNSVGITAIIDRDADGSAIDRYAEAARGRCQLPVRLGISHHIDTLGSARQILRRIRQIAAHPLRTAGPGSASSASRPISTAAC